MTEIEKLKEEIKALKELLVDGCRVLYWNTELIDPPMGRYPHRTAKVWFDEAWKVGHGND